MGIMQWFSRNSVNKVISKQTFNYDDVTLIPHYSELNSRSEADPTMKEFSLPIIASCMDVLGKDMASLFMDLNIPFICHRSFKCALDQYNYFIGLLSDYHRYHCLWFAVGSVKKYRLWIEYLFNHGVRQFCVDMAHGDSKACVDTIKFIKLLFKKEKKFSKKIKQFVLEGQKPHIIAGNVATLEGFKRLQRAGANGIRVGVGSGSICSTAISCAMGVPILTNILDIAPYKKKNTWLIADGGIKYTGDIAKAVYFGADFCMIGKMLAATDLSTGKCYNKLKKLIQNTNTIYGLNEPCFNRPIYPHEFELMYKKALKYDWTNGDISLKRKIAVKSNVVAYKSYHGMASREARKGLLSYASPEGASGIIKYTCSTKQFLNDTFLRLQASLSYGGSRTWNEFRKKVKACFRSNAGIIAAETHLDVTFDK